MINNLLKVVGGESNNEDTYSTSHTAAASDIGSESSNNNNLASTIGGFINNFQETIQQLDGSKSMSPTSGGGLMGSPRGYKSNSNNSTTSGRSYYSDGTVDRRLLQQRREGSVNYAAQQQQTSLMIGHQRKQQSKSNKNNNIQPSINNGIYQGRKMISDISDLYNVVNDKESIENYDTLMEITSLANTEATERLSTASDYTMSSTGGGSINYGPDRKSSQEQKQSWARVKEEELVDRMLSQFPEFGTNRPTPFIVLDEDDDDDEDGNEKKKSKVDSSNAQDEVSGVDSLYSPTQFFTNDATDLIGKFFGMPSSDTSNNNSKAGVEGREGPGTDNEFKRSSSFGSSSTLSTMSASAAGSRKVGTANISAVEQGNTKVDQSAAVPDTATREVNELDYTSGWDQDEIDLWSSKIPPIMSLRSASEAKMQKQKRGATSASVSVSNNRRQLKTLPVITKPKESSQRNTNDQEQQPQEEEDDSWASRRRKHRERRKKRQDWDALKSSQQQQQQPPMATNGSVASHPMSGSQALLSALPNREPPAANNGNEPSIQEASQQYDRGGGGGAVIVDDGKQHWMPDNLCKHCYSCEAPFNLIRRKHHCRVCGMIFCSACSAYFVQISSSDGANGSVMSDGKQSASGTIRTCKICYDHLSERGLGVVMRGDTVNEEGNRSRTSSSDLNMRKQSSTKSVDKLIEEGTASRPALTRKGSTQLLPTTTESKDNNIGTSSATSNQLKEQFTGFHGEEGSSVKGNYHALSITKQRLEEEKTRRDEQERAEAEATRRLAEEEAALVAKEANNNNMEGRSPSSRLKSRLSTSQLKWKGSSKYPNSNDDYSETINARSDSVEVSVGDSEGASKTNRGSFIPGQRPSAEGIRAVASTLESDSAFEDALFGSGQSSVAKKSARIRLGNVAADYLEKLGRELLRTDAPLLLEEIKAACAGSSPFVEKKLTDTWVNTLMTLSTRCCATVEPDVKSGDLLDIRPYCKLKVIPGGSVEDSAYMSGIMFRKTVSHKKMARIIPNAKIMMLSGGIEYRSPVIASLDTLLEQEERYMEILVTKIFKLKPNVLICGKSVCRKAQELLLRANIVLLQYVKPTLMTRIARQTGATVLSSIDHVLNSTILGYCRRFRLVSFRDNDVWVDGDITEMKNVSSKQKSSVKSVPRLLSKNIPNHERQAALAARKLGEGVLDGMDAVTLGLAKRGVVNTYVMLEGCPKELGCTVVLRGASRPALKMVKQVLSFLINCSYNMKLETSYMLERCCRLPPSYEIPSTPCCSSSLCIDFGRPPNNRKSSRPWNGGKNDPAQRSLSGKITPLDHQAILITSVWMTDKTQCCPAEVKGICYYSMQDVSLGQFLRDSCFNLSLKCQNPSCKKSVIDHSLSFIHNDGLINISVEKMDNPVPIPSLEKQQKDLDSTSASKIETSPDYEPIATWTYCTKCDQVVTPLIFLSKQTWSWSFGKFLEVYFYNRDAIINAPGHRCSCRMQTSSQLFFGCGNLAARFTYEKISPYSVFCRRHLPFDEVFHRTHSLQDLGHISVTSSSLFIKYDQQIDVISRETRDLFGSALNKPEHLQAVLSELSLISSEVDSATKVLQEKISSVTAKYSKADSSQRAEYNEALFNFPFFSRRYLFMLASAWNERLSAAGQALTAMKKVQQASAASRGGDSAAVQPDTSTDDVLEKMRVIRVLQETYARNYNVSKMSIPQTREGGLFEGNILPDGRAVTLEQEALEKEAFFGGEDDAEGAQDIDFEEDIDADVLASRNRVYSPSAASSTTSSKKSSRQRPTKVLGGKRPSDLIEEEANTSDQSSTPLALANNYDSSGQLDQSQGKSKTVTAGGAVKSALNRFFNRGGNKEDPYTVDLGYFGMGRPRLQPGVDGLVIPVFDDQPSTIIAHSLASSDYELQFKQFSSATSQPESRSEPSRKDTERRMLGRNKSHIKHTFRDFDEKGQQLCKFVCTTFWSVQFNAVRQAFMSPTTSSKDSSSDTGSTKSGGGRIDIEKSYIRSLATSFAWNASGGKSGASFSRTTDDRFVIKCISRTELQMFLDCAPGKSALVLFYVMNSCVQYKVSMT